MVMKMKPDAETIPALVARVRLPPMPAPARVNGGPPKLNNVTAADIARLNADRSIENRVMNQRDAWGAAPSERNRIGQVGGFAGINADLTFSRIAASPFGNSSYMRSRRTDGSG
jgi:hypothetical protein